MVWGAFCSNAMLDLAFPSTRMNYGEYIDIQNIEVIDWPVCSSDQNPMENIWGILARRVYAQNRQYKDVFELKEAIIDEWRAISKDMRTKLVQSMPDRIFELIQNKAGPTHY